MSMSSMLKVITGKRSQQVNSSQDLDADILPTSSKDNCIFLEETIAS